MSASNHQYYRIRSGTNTSGFRRYVVTSKTPRVNEFGEDEYPYGTMVVDVLPTTYTVNQDNTANGQLFRETPGKVYMSEAFFDERIRHAFPTMGALIKNDYPGKTIAASEDLSKHSAPIAQKFADMGVIEHSYGGEPFRQTNDLDFEDMSSDSPHYAEYMYGSNAKKVNERDILGAKDTLRGILRSNREVKRPRSSQKLSPQFEQLRLPGFD